MPTAIIEIATGYVVEQGAIPDGVRYAQVTCPTNPDARREKWSGGAFVAKTAGEIAAYYIAQVVRRARAASRQRDILATLAVIVRAMDVPAWEAMGLGERVTAVRAEAERWTAFWAVLEGRDIDA